MGLVRVVSDSDDEWEKFGRDDPYYGVLVDPRFRREQLTPQALEDFFASGRTHVERVFEVVERSVAPGFAPRRALDFGCGVGRVLVALAARCEEAVGADVSPSMLGEAERNCAARGIANVRLVRTDDALTGLDGRFDLVHSFIVLQHVEPSRGHRSIDRLLERVADDGVAVLHVTFANDLGRRERWLRWGRSRFAPLHRLLNRREGKPAGQPFMEMSRYDLNRIFRSLQDHGMDCCHVRFTRHFRHRGVLLFARKRTLDGF